MSDDVCQREPARFKQNVTVHEKSRKATLASFNRRRRMKAESRQIPQKLAASLKFFTVFDTLRESLPLLFSANVDIY